VKGETVKKKEKLYNKR